MKNQKLNFLYALIVTILVFNLGLFLGYTLESSRIAEIHDWSFQTEMNTLDQRLQSQALDLLDLDCDLLIQNNIDFANEIYGQALVIDRYEKASRINEDIKEEHKRLDLLRSLMWMNSIEIKTKCGATYHNVVYFYQYNEPTLEQKAEQRFYSNLLGEIKNEYGNEVLLVPVAGDNNLPSVNLLVNKFNITKFPSILVDEKHLITNVESSEDVTIFLN